MVDDREPVPSRQRTIAPATSGSQPSEAWQWKSSLVRFDERSRGTLVSGIGCPSGQAAGRIEDHPMATEEQIRNYAHQLWEKAGRPEGRDTEFWHAAEVELNAESESPDATTPPDQPDSNVLPGG
jgi:hypothetical protein